MSLCTGPQRVQGMLSFETGEALKEFSETFKTD